MATWGVLSYSQWVMVLDLLGFLQHWEMLMLGSDMGIELIFRPSMPQPLILTKKRSLERACFLHLKKTQSKLSRNHSLQGPPSKPHPSPTCDYFKGPGEEVRRDGEAADPLDAESRRRNPGEQQRVLHTSTHSIYIIYVHYLLLCN